MKSDAMIRTDVLAELDFDPAITSTGVGVAVKDGVVTLTGHPASHAEKQAIERAVRRVKGVRAIAVEMTVKLAAANERTDTDIARAVEQALEWHVLVPHERIRVKVEEGWVTLGGEVEWAYQRHAAEIAVQGLQGVKGVRNEVQINPTCKPENVRESIQAALERRADREAHHIEVSVIEAQVTLSGKVHSWEERQAVQGAAWAAPGVKRVINHLLVER